MAADGNDGNASETGSFGEWDDKMSSEVTGFFGKPCASPAEAWAELQSAADFDFLAWLQTLQGERMYAYIKLVNFIRQKEDPLTVDWQSFKAGDLASDDLLLPVLEGDGLLEAYCLVDSDDDLSDDDEDGAQAAANEV